MTNLKPLGKTWENNAGIQLFTVRSRSWRPWKSALGLVLAGVLLSPECAWLTGEASAQWHWEARQRRIRIPDRDVFPQNTFTFCRLKYSSWGAGWGWDTDYPDSDLNFSMRLEELTNIKVNRDENGRIKHAVVDLMDEDLFNYPFLYMLEVGQLTFSKEEQERLREYLLRGGFLMVDDFWGDAAWENWVVEIAGVLPPDRFPMKPVPLDHAIFNIVFPVKEVPQVPSVGHYPDWVRSGNTYEWRYPTTDPSPHCKGIWDEDGERLMVVVLHNTDLGDGWEREGDNEGYFKHFSAKKAYPLGINIVVYAMTH